MAIIKAIDKDRSGFILQELDMQTCLIQPDKIEELERLVKAVSVHRSRIRRLHLADHICTQRIKQHLPDVDDESGEE
jgi:hypothetical protein